LKLDIPALKYMIILEDSIEIRTTPERILDWFEHLNRNFVLWNQNHKRFVKITGGMEVGDVVRFEQRISGKWYKYNLRICRKEISGTGWTIEAKTSFIAQLTFITEKTGDVCIFKHVESFGFIENPLVGKWIG
jgi:hypothetical protein